MMTTMLDLAYSAFVPHATTSFGITMVLSAIAALIYSGATARPRARAFLR